MELPAQLKSKKVLLGLGAVVVILVGIFVLKFMSSGGTEGEPRKAQSAPQTRKPISKPKKEEPEKSPLFEALKSWKDPFRGEDPEVVELQDKINATKKEIEYLKASLEEKKLRQEIKELEKSIRESAGTSTPRAETEIGATGGKKGKDESQKRVLVKAILMTDDEKSALIVSGDRTSWVHEGEEFDGWEIKEIKKDSVVLLRAGKTYVFFYDRRHISKES
jgi:type IV pilus biogenesis protein PilP